MNKEKDERTKDLENMINDLTLTVSMYHHGYPFDENHKHKQRLLMCQAYMLIGTPINTRGMAKSVGFDDFKTDDPVEIIITEDEARTLHKRLKCAVDYGFGTKTKTHTFCNIIDQIKKQIDIQQD